MINQPLSLVPSRNTSSDCSNSGFENGDFTGWTKSFGCHRFPKIGRGCQKVYAATSEGYCCSRVMTDALHPQTSDPAFEIVTSADIISKTRLLGTPITAVPQDGGAFAVKIGDDSPSVYAFRLEKTFKVTKDNALLTYWYIMLLNETGGHGLKQNPYFEVNIYDSNDDPLRCTKICKGTSYFSIPDS